jgi:superoxide dismutase, Cu-Zn family
MKKCAAILLPLIALSSGGVARPSRPVSATATLFSNQGRQVGGASLSERNGNLYLALYVSGLTPGDHGIHFHTVGLCSSPDFASAGGHWNPQGKQHGLENPQGYHGGDIPNLHVGANGRAKIHLTLATGPLTNGSHALLDSDGGSIVIHENPDDMRTDPSGNSGKRLVCGVWKRDIEAK